MAVELAVRFFGAWQGIRSVDCVCLCSPYRACALLKGRGVWKRGMPLLSRYRGNETNEKKIADRNSRCLSTHKDRGDMFRLACNILRIFALFFLFLQQP